MPCPTALEPKTISLLYEIYEVPFRDATVITSGVGNASNITSYDYQTGVKQQLIVAIAAINLAQGQINRVTEIVGEYDKLSLDRSTIERDGYSLQPNRNIRAIRDALYPYTGIVFRKQQGNRVPLA